MQTMTALVRVQGNVAMTVKLRMVTPAEALLLMHIHDADTKDVFENATLTGDVERSRMDERMRLKDKYPQYAKLVEELFPGRTASDVPERFSELEGTPLSVAMQGKQEEAARITHAAVQTAPPDAGDAFVAPRPQLSQEQLRELAGTG
jgi:hypothetical protein